MSLASEARDIPTCKRHLPRKPANLYTREKSLATLDRGGEWAPPLAGLASAPGRAGESQQPLSQWPRCAPARAAIVFARAVCRYIGMFQPETCPPLTAPAPPAPTMSAASACPRECEARSDWNLTRKSDLPPPTTTRHPFLVEQCAPFPAETYVHSPRPISRPPPQESTLGRCLRFDNHVDHLARAKPLWLVPAG